jgi:hypothetical protein
MTESFDETRRAGVLALNLALVSICVLTLAVVAVLYGKFFAPAPLPTATITHTPRPTLAPSASSTASLTPSITPTPAPSLTPTVTHTPTRTGTPTEAPTSTPFPQLTQARPAVLPDNYSLHPWDPGEAEYMARVVEGYPASLELSPAEDPAYYEAFHPAVFAWREALLRFPDVPQAETWRWNLARNLARTGSSEAGNQYARLISGALNRDDTDLLSLYAWFAGNEPDLSLFMTDVKPPEGYLAAYVIELTGEAGSAFIWLLQSTGAYTAYPLLTRFDFINPLDANWVVAELDGDAQNGQEVAIYYSDPEDPFLVDAPTVFDLSQLPPRVLPFLPEQDVFQLGVDFDNRWLVDTGAGGAKRLVFEAKVFPACPTTVSQPYEWNGEYFQAQTPTFAIEPAAATLPLCMAVVDHAIAHWGPAAAIAVMEPLLDDWPPAEDLEGEPYPPDARDEFLFRLGIYHALLGEQDVAVDLFNQISTQPTVYNSRWIRPAQTFLAAYQQPEDIYRACVLTEQCDPRYAIQYLVGLTGAEASAFEELKAAGLNPNASGYFDFDGDEQAERWFTTRYRERQRNDFWILSQIDQGHQALLVGPVDNVPPKLETLEEAYIADDGLTRMPAVFLDGTYSFTMRRRPETDEAYLLPVPLRKEYPSRFFVPLEAAQNALLAGQDPEEIQDELLALQDFPGLLCAPTWTCDSYYYLLGLASELAGDEEAAVEAYHRLWLDYSRSPYTTMARLKLAGGPVQPPSTPSPAATSTAAAGTPAPTGSATPSPTSTSGPTPTPTITGTPPTATPSPTASLPPTATNTVDPYNIYP